MQDLFTQEASIFGAAIDDRLLERIVPKMWTPDLMNGRTSLTVYPGMTGMSENVSST